MGFSLQEMGSTTNLEHFVCVFNHLEDMVFLIEVEEEGVYRCVEVNPAYLKATGLLHEAVKNKRIEEIFSAREAKAVIENYQKAIFKKKTLKYEETMVLINQEKIFETTIIPIFNKDNQHCDYILGVSRDISERKKYEKALLEAKRELEKILNQHQGLILKAEKRDGEFCYTICDGQIINQLGLTSEDIVEKRPQDIFSEETAANIIMQLQYCWESKEKVTFEVADNIRGNDFYWLAIVNPIVEKGETVSLIIYAIDLMERKKSEEQLIQTEKLALVGELAAGIGHELRNPLTAIRGFLKFMRENKDGVREEFFDIIDSEIESLNHIASELMILAKPQEQQFVNLNMIQLLDEVVFLLEPEAFRQGIKMVKNYREEKVPVFGEKYQLKQVLINLIKNAIDALDGHPEGKIAIDCVHDVAQVSVKITDNGSGIPKEILEKLGEPFYTTKEKGTGLGLLVTYRIVKNHEGKIKCESEEGKGTSFIISFPLLSQK